MSLALRGAHAPDAESMKVAKLDSYGEQLKHESYKEQLKHESYEA